jgi:CRISPR/Cas system-associated endonuclease Cas1
MPFHRISYRFFKGDLALPPRILLLDGSGTISFAVLSWLAEQRVPLVRVTWQGEVATVAAVSGFAADQSKVAWQLDTQSDERRRVAFSTGLVRRKLRNAIATLESQLPGRRLSEIAAARIAEADVQLSEHLPSDVSALRAVEAPCASAYFAAWKEISLKWAGTSRRPIPEDWRRFTSRTSLANGHKLRNVNASHPLNAILNYAYTVLQSRLQIEAVADGYDPTIGIMHQKCSPIPRPLRQ